MVHPRTPKETLINPSRVGSGEQGTQAEILFEIESCLCDIHDLLDTEFDIINPKFDSIISNLGKIVKTLKHPPEL